MSVKFDSEKGKFGKNDKIITVDGVRLTLPELSKALILIRDNENNRDGKGYLNQHGDSLFKTMLWKIHQGITFDKLEPFLKSGFRRDDFEEVGFDSKEWGMVFCERCGKRAYCKDCKKYLWRKKNEKS